MGSQSLIELGFATLLTRRILDKPNNSVAKPNLIGIVS